MKSTDKIIELSRQLREEIANVVGAGKIAGTKELGDDPPVDLRKYKNKLSMFYRRDLINKKEKRNVRSKMLGLGKLQVLESKLDIYEDLSKEMLSKLENAVTTISENSNRVAVVLERHETRLDEGDKSNQLIIRMIEEMKDQEEKNLKSFMKELIEFKRK